MELHMPTLAPATDMHLDKLRIPTRRLGLNAIKHDRRTLHLSKYLMDGIDQAPPNCDWNEAVGDQWGMMLNDQEGDCAIACPYHMAMCMSLNVGKKFIYTDEQVQADYMAVTASEGAGFDPNTGLNDNGCNELDVLNYWTKTGMMGGADKIIAYVQVDPSNFQHLRYALSLFGPLMTGIALPEAASDQIDAGQPWTTPYGTFTQYFPHFRPGSWGGHAVPFTSYAQSGMWNCITWGKKQAMTQGFIQTYCQEAYAVISPDWIDAKGISASHIALADLLSDAKKLQGV